MSTSDRVKASWTVRRERYGPSGGNVGNLDAEGGRRHYLPGAHTHGHRNTYSRVGCRCVWCSEANRKYHRTLAGRRKMSVANGQGPLRHGHSGYSNHGCRCTDCRVAYYLKDVTADVILRAHGIGRDGNDFLMVARTPSPFINARRTALLMLGEILPEDFDDDTRITSAQLQYHPPQAWLET